jgi:hypothetical protein
MIAACHHLLRILIFSIEVNLFDQLAVLSMYAFDTLYVGEAGSSPLLALSDVSKSVTEMTMPLAKMGYCNYKKSQGRVGLRQFSVLLSNQRILC